MARYAGNRTDALPGALMYSRNGKKSRSGSVVIRNSHDRLQLVFSFKGKRFYLSTGLGDNPYNRKLAMDKALEVERDIAYGEFNPESLTKYKPSTVLNPDVATAPVSVALRELPEFWKLYTVARSSGKSPATIRMYGWLANHLNRCPYRLPGDSQAIFDWLNANVPANSAKRVLMHLAACCKWAKKSGLLDSNPFEGSAAEVKVKKRGTEEEEINPFTREKIKCLRVFCLFYAYKIIKPTVGRSFKEACIYLP